MNRDQALELLNSNLKNKNLIKHCLAVEAAMLGLAKHFNQNQDDWAIAGLLHDIDYDLVVPDKLDQHSKLGAQMLKEAGLSQDICDAVLTHNEMHGIEPKTLMGKALHVVDPLTGLIVATALVLPSKKLADVKTETIINRMGEKSFAKGANREIINKGPEFLDLAFEEFVNIVLTSMQEISSDLGL